MRLPDIEGPCGEGWNMQPRLNRAAWKMNKAGLENGVLASWLLHVPNSHFDFNFYNLMVCELRPLLGEEEPAHKIYEEAEYELMLVLLDEEDKIDPDEGEFIFAFPLQVVIQFHGVSPEIIRDMLQRAAISVLAGELPAFCGGDIGAWELAVRGALQHYIVRNGIYKKEQGVPN